MRLLPITLLLLSAVAWADPRGDVADTLRRATALYEEALGQEHGWSVTEPLLEQAQEALEAGDTERARELADRALLTAEQSLKQARSEADSWRNRVVRD